MPLSFESLSHGNIAFGFFNIETDMLLLENYFFFADNFCRYISDIAKSGDLEFSRSFRPVYHIEKPGDLGDLMSAIYGIEHTGFIGEVYRGFPFPQKEEEFKQKPEGSETRKIVKSIISKYSKVIEVPLAFEEEATLGRYKFSRESFAELLKYVWQGGYPRWRDEQRPDYVLSMKAEIERSRGRLFEGVVFED